MFARFCLSGVLILTAGAAVAQTTEQQARNAINWEIFQKLYPPRAIATREEGDVGFTVTLNNKGDVVGCQVTHTSGHPLLDEETCKIITLNAVFTPDAALSPSQTKTHEGMITWRLPDWAKAESLKPILPAANSPAVAAERPIVVTGVPEKVVCKKTVRVGTLAGFERTCMTPTEWAKQSDETKQPWDELQGRKGSSRCISLGSADTGSLQVADGKVASNGVAGCE